MDQLVAQVVTPILQRPFDNQPGHTGDCGLDLNVDDLGRADAGAREKTRPVDAGGDGRQVVGGCRVEFLAWITGFRLGQCDLGDLGLQREHACRALLGIIHAHHLEHARNVIDKELAHLGVFVLEIDVAGRQ